MDSLTVLKWESIAVESMAATMVDTTGYKLAASMAAKKASKTVPMTEMDWVGLSAGAMVGQMVGMMVDLMAHLMVQSTVAMTAQAMAMHSV